MSTKNITNLDHSGVRLIIINGDEDDLSWLYEIQDDTPKEKLIYVALRGTTDKYLYSDRFLVENYHVDMANHFLYNGKFTDQEEKDYIVEKALEFSRSGRRLFIEDYEFTQPLDFYDYTK